MCKTPKWNIYLYLPKRFILSVLLPQVPSSLKRKKLLGFIISSIQAESGHGVICELHKIIYTILRLLNNWIMASRTHLLLKQLSLLITKFSTLKQTFGIFPVNPGTPCAILSNYYQTTTTTVRITRFGFSTLSKVHIHFPPLDFKKVLSIYLFGHISMPTWLVVAEWTEPWSDLLLAKSRISEMQQLRSFVGWIVEVEQGLFIIQICLWHFSVHSLSLKIKIWWSTATMTIKTLLTAVESMAFALYVQYKIHA